MIYFNNFLQPGDGTRYTCVVAPASGGCTFVGIGPGEHITGGYPLAPHIVEQAPAFLYALVQGAEMPNDFGYLKSKYRGLDAMSIVNALTLAWLYSRSPINIDDRIKIVGLAYTRKLEGLVAALQKEEQLSSYAFGNVTYTELLRKCLALAYHELDAEDFELDPDLNDTIAGAVKKLGYFMEVWDEN